MPLVPPQPLRGRVQRSPHGDTQQYFSAQAANWKSPGDILSILMIIGGDIVQRAVAQLAGSGPWRFAPVAFSFGWLAYSVSALTSAVGDGRLMPPPEFATYVVNAHSGYQRSNRSWVLGRLLRDHENRVHRNSALTVEFFRTVADRRPGVPTRDHVYWSGVVAIVLQLGIAVIPGVLSRNWLVLIVTIGGTLLALITSGLPQWHDDKYCAREVDPKKGREVVCITRRNGSNYAMVVVSERTGFRLEDLACGGRDKHRTLSSAMPAFLCVLWIVLLLTVEGLDGDAWFLLAIGGLGMVQNIFAAGAQRSAAALGLPLESSGCVSAKKVMLALQEAEKKEAGVGLCMLKIYFPGELRQDEVAYWDGVRACNIALKAAQKAGTTMEVETLPKPKDVEMIPPKMFSYEQSRTESIPSVSSTYVTEARQRGSPSPSTSGSTQSTLGGRRVDTTATLTG